MKFSYPRLLVLLPILSLGCPDKDTLSDEILAGDVDLCAGLSGQPAPDTGFAWDLEGEVLGEVAGDDLDTGEPCSGSERVIEIAADDGKSYQLGYGLYDEDDALIASSLGLAAGDRVQLELLATIGYFYTGYGLVLRREGALVAAISDNKAPSLDELSVGEGDQIASEDNDCGERRGWELVFTADDTLTLAPVASGELTVSGVPMSALALAAWDWSPESGESCTDLIGFWEWAVVPEL